MTTSDRYIAAIEISSSKIIGAVGKISSDGELNVIALEQEQQKGEEAVRYGIIHNLEETSMRIARIIANLERKPELGHRKIKGVFVGLSGRSVKSIPTNVSINLARDTEITNEILNRLKGDALRTAIDPSLDIVDAVPRTYRVGNTDTTSPKGIVGNSISATFDLIVCRPELKRNITRTIVEKLNLRIEGFIVTALAAAHLILTPDEKRLGCMLVDMGAETTTVTIHKNGCMRYFATIPMGGRNITRDITSLNMLEEKAEETKITSGNAIAPDTPSTLNINGIKHSDISNLIVARAEEIVANVVEQIEYAGLKENDLPGGIIVIGGGSRLNGMIDLLAAQSNLPVRRGQVPAYVVINDTHYTSADIIQVVSLLYAGATLSDRVCLEEPPSDELPPMGRPNEPEEIPEEKPKGGDKKPSRFISGLKKRLSNLWTAPTDDSDELD